MVPCYVGHVYEIRVSNATASNLSRDLISDPVRDIVASSCSFIFYA
jgi:hypothetical protein